MNFIIGLFASLVAIIVFGTFGVCFFGAAIETLLPERKNVLIKSSKYNIRGKWNESFWVQIALLLVPLCIGFFSTSMGDKNIGVKLQTISDGTYFVVVENKSIFSLSVDSVSPISLEFHEPVRPVDIDPNYTYSLPSPNSILITKAGLSPFTRLYIPFKSQNAPALKSVKVEGNRISLSSLFSYSMMIFLMLIAWAMSLVLRVFYFYRLFLQMNTYRDWMEINASKIERVISKYRKNEAEIGTLISEADIKNLLQLYPDVYKELLPPTIYGTFSQLRIIRNLAGISIAVDIFIFAKLI